MQTRDHQVMFLPLRSISKQEASTERFVLVDQSMSTPHWEMIIRENLIERERERESRIPLSFMGDMFP